MDKELYLSFAKIIFHNDGNKKGEGERELTLLEKSMIYPLFQMRGFKVLIYQFKSYSYKIDLIWNCCQFLLFISIVLSNNRVNKNEKKNHL